MSSIADDSLVAAKTRLPRWWMVGAIWSGIMPRMNAENRQKIIAAFRRLGKEKGEAAQLLEIKQMENRYANTKASALENSQKNSSVMANTGLLVAAVVTLLVARQPVVVMIGLVAVILLALAIMVANTIFSPKAKNWRRGCNEDVSGDGTFGALGDLKAALEGNQLERRYMHNVDMYYHWDLLVLLERRMFSVVCWLSNVGISQASVAIVFAALLAKLAN